MSTPPSASPYKFSTDLTFTSGDKIGSNTKVPMSAAVAAQGWIPGDPLPAGRLNDLQNNTYLWLEWLRTYAGGGQYGDGSDGDVSIGAGTTVLTRGMLYNNLTVPSGAILQPAGYIIRARTKILIEAGGIIENNGIAGTDGGAGGGGGTPAVVGAGTGGGTGGAGNAVGSAGTTNNDAYGGAGAAGGTAGGFAGGAGGTIGAPAGSAGDVRALPGAIGQIIGAGGLTRWGGGAGGGGGGSDDAGGDGGGGGGGGRVLVLMAPEIEIEAGGVLQALGGAGGDGVGASCGGGGGGGGGVVSLVYRFANATIATMTGDGRISVAGGAAGAGVGGAANGSAGSAGTVFELRH